MKKIDIYFDDEQNNEEEEIILENLVSLFKLDYYNVVRFTGYVDDSLNFNSECTVWLKAVDDSEFGDIITFNAHHGKLIGKCTFDLTNSLNQKIFYNFIDDDYAEIYYPNGNIYQGKVENFKKKGFGKLIFSKDFYCEGYFIDNKNMHGVVRYYNKNNKLIDIKVFKNGICLANSLDENIINQVVLENNLDNYDFSKKLNKKKSIFELKKAIKKIETSIVGQNSVKEKITNNLLLSLLCDRENNKPVTSMLFTGPTGVGKTEMAKQIAKYLFNGKLYTVDFANFNNKNMISSLIGAPAGYIGHDAKPDFLKFIQENQDGGVILFDELDKADEECYNILMRMLDEGEVISAKNETYKVNNFVIIFTTNMSENYKTKKLGFGENTNKEKELKEGLANGSTGLKKEQLARINLVAEFTKLTKEENIQIIKNTINEIINQLKTINGYKINISYKDKTLEDILNSTSSDLGVREIKRQTEKLITEELAKFIKNHDENNIKVKIKSLKEVEISASKSNTKELDDEKLLNFCEIVK